jgi:hypothetical protein
MNHKGGEPCGSSARISLFPLSFEEAVRAALATGKSPKAARNRTAKKRKARPAK